MHDMALLQIYILRLNTSVNFLHSNDKNNTRKEAYSSNALLDSIVKALTWLKSVGKTH